MFSHFISWFFAQIAATQEYRGFGLNMLTLGLVFTTVTLLMEVWGLSKQIQTSWAPKDSGTVVSITKKCVAVAYFFTVFNYGLTIKSLSLWGSLVIGVLQLVIVFELLRLKRLQWWEWLSAAGCALIVLLSFATSYTTELFFLVSVILLPPGLAMQPIEMMRAKTRKGLAPADPLMFCISSVIWVFFALALGSWLIAGVSLLYASLYAWTLILWKRYEPKPGFAY